jgi:hypothetical protein
VRQITLLDRLLLLATVLLSAYQVVIGIEGLGTLAMASYTIAFGVLLVACLLLIILGLEVLDSPLVVIVSTVIPLSLSLGLVAEYLPDLTVAYLLFVLLGFIAVVLTRVFSPGPAAVITLAVVHGISGLLIFLLPIALTIGGETNTAFLLVSLGGALIGIAGLLLAFLKTGKPILPQETILAILPALLLLMTACFVAGFALV